MSGEVKKSGNRWANRSEEDRLRCRATERRDGRLVQCTGNRKEPHEHMNRGVRFKPGYQEAPTAAPTLPPNSPFKGMT